MLVNRHRTVRDVDDDGGFEERLAPTRGAATTSADTAPPAVPRPDEPQGAGRDEERPKTRKGR